MNLLDIFTYKDLLNQAEEDLRITETMCKFCNKILNRGTMIFHYTKNHPEKEIRMVFETEEKP